MRRIACVAFFLLSVLVSSARAQHHYVLDKAHTTIGFSVSHMVVSEVDGRFNEFEGELELDDSLTPTRVAVTIQAASIDTAVAKRDEHLRNEDFFHVEKYPTIRFVGKRVETEGDRRVLVGDLTILDTTREVRLPYTIAGPIQDPWGNTRIGIRADTTINRRDFGLTWNRMLEAGGLTVGNEVKITIKAEAIRK
ncbi:MAG: YceI family protein [Verrucomicrobiae bacterium]|nr:YceI family protein [Verrucomicrobiae bacterium]